MHCPKNINKFPALAHRDFPVSAVASKLRCTAPNLGSVMSRTWPMTRLRVSANEHRNPAKSEYVYLTPNNRNLSYRINAQASLTRKVRSFLGLVLVSRGTRKLPECKTKRTSPTITMHVLFLFVGPYFTLQL